LRLQQLARGEGRRPLRPREPPPVFAESLELDHPVELLEPLAFVLARLLDQLCHRLEERALAVQELRLVLKLEKGEHVRALRLPLPMRAPREFLKLLQLDLSSHPPGAPVRAVTIAAQPAPPRVTQEGLFEPAAPQAEKLEVTLARLVALVGEGHVGSPELIDTHRPGAFRMTEWRRLQPAPAGKLQPAPHRLAFRVYRPPLRVKVTLRGGRPVYISGRGPITAAAGPWRSSGEWWTASSWEQDSWDVLSGGVLYRLCLGKEGWVLEGVYD
jgi:protein ImuB